MTSNPIVFGVAAILILLVIFAGLDYIDRRHYRKLQQTSRQPWLVKRL